MEHCFVLFLSLCLFLSVCVSYFVLKVIFYPQLFNTFHASCLIKGPMSSCFQQSEFCVKSQSPLPLCFKFSSAVSISICQFVKFLTQTTNAEVFLFVSEYLYFCAKYICCFYKAIFIELNSSNFCKSVHQIKLKFTKYIFVQYLYTQTHLCKHFKLVIVKKMSFSAALPFLISASLCFALCPKQTVFQWNSA